MTAFIILNDVGENTGPFSLYSDVDGFLVPFQINIPRVSMISGYAAHNVPDGTTIIRIKSVNSLCNNDVDVNVTLIVTTTTTTTI